MHLKSNNTGSPMAGLCEGNSKCIKETFVNKECDIQSSYNNINSGIYKKELYRKVDLYGGSQDADIQDDISSTEMKQDESVVNLSDEMSGPTKAISETVEVEMKEVIPDKSLYTLKVKQEDNFMDHLGYMIENDPDIKPDVPLSTETNYGLFEDNYDLHALIKAEDNLETFDQKQNLGDGSQNLYSIKSEEMNCLTSLHKMNIGIATPINTQVEQLSIKKEMDIDESVVPLRTLALKTTEIKQEIDFDQSINNQSNLCGIQSTCTSTSASASSSTKPVESDDNWSTVGIFKGTSYTVQEYIDNKETAINCSDLCLNNLPDLSKFPKIKLEPGKAYRFRVAAINLCGTGEWSEESEFRTTQPGYPGAPSAVKITKSAEGVHLTWVPPISADDSVIIEYSVHLAIKIQDSTSSKVTFMRVYCGPTNKCVVPSASFASAHLDTTTKPSIIFRIAARNEKGYGPATQVKWVQELASNAQKRPAPEPKTYSETLSKQPKLE